MQIIFNANVILAVLFRRINLQPNLRRFS